VLHMPLVSPRPCAANASAASRSSLPALTSLSICLSQASASYFANHSREAANSCGVSFATSLSRDSTLLIAE
jgi:hypothetical protein